MIVGFEGLFDVALLVEQFGLAEARLAGGRGERMAAGRLVVKFDGARGFACFIRLFRLLIERFSFARRGLGAARQQRNVGIVSAG